jgi:predicted nucleic acid-binding protein
MSAADRLTVDSNVLIYAADREAGTRHEQAMRVMARAAQADCVLTLQALAEFFAVATRKVGVSAADAIVFVEGWQALFECAGATLDTVGMAMRAVDSHRIAFWDAMIWAVAREAGCRYLLGEDFQHGRTLDGVTFVNPFALTGLPDDLERALGGG